MISDFSTQEILKAEADRVLEYAKQYVEQAKCWRKFSDKTRSQFVPKKPEVFKDKLQISNWY